MTTYKPHDSHGQQMTPELQHVIDASDKRERDRAAMPADCTTPSGCRAHGCHGACIPSEYIYCWLVEMFHRGEGAPSLGCYYTGFTDLAHQARSTRDPHEAKKYKTRDEANEVAERLNVWMKSCEWRAVEHGFAG